MTNILRENVIVEPDPDREYESMAPIYGYMVLMPGSSRVSIGLQNYSCHKVTVPAKSIIAKVSAANVVPPSLAPNLDNEATLITDPRECWSTRGFESPRINTRKGGTPF